MSAPGPAPHLRLKCRLHPCPAYRVLPPSPASTNLNTDIPTLAQIGEQAISAWQLPSSAGYLLAVRDEDGDEVVIWGEEEWEGLLASLPGARSTAREVLLRLALHRDPRLPQPHAALCPSSTPPTPPAPVVVKSAMDERNDALAASFEDMLSRARSTETAPGRARAYADRFYAVSRGPTTVGEGEGEGEGASSSGGGAGGAVPVNAGAGAGPKKKEEEEGGKKGKGKEDWRVRADQLYGSLVAVRPRPPRSSSPAAATATEPQHSDEPSSTAPAADDDEGEVAAKQEDPPSPSIPPVLTSAHNPEKHQPDTDGTSTAQEQEQESRPSAEPVEGNSGRRPKRPVEEVNAELSSAWEIMLSRMHG